MTMLIPRWFPGDLGANEAEQLLRSIRLGDVIGKFSKIDIAFKTSDNVQS